MSLLLLLFAVCLTWFPAPVQAARSAALDPTPTIRLEPFQPTMVVFPEPLNGLFPGVSEDALGRKQDGPYLVLLAKVPDLPPGRLFVVGRSGERYLVKYVIDTARPDDEVRLTAKAQPQAKARPFTTVSFMRYLREDKTIPEQYAVDIPLPQISDPRIHVVQSQAYRVQNMTALILTVQNTEAQPYVLDIRVNGPANGDPKQVIALSQWTWPPMLDPDGVSAKAMHETMDGLPILGPNGQARLYIVFRGGR